MGLLYLQTRFSLSSAELGCELGLVGLASSLSLLFVVPWLQPKMGTLSLMRLGLAVNAVSIGSFALVQEWWQAYLPPLGCLFGFAVFPLANTLASACVPRCQQGAAQGVISGARSLAEGVSPVLFGWMFQAVVGSACPGAPFAAAGACVAVALVLST